MIVLLLPLMEKWIIAYESNEVEMYNERKNLMPI